jgi:hypothetical protein
MWGETLGIKDTLLHFMTILRAGPDPRALKRLTISTIQNNRQSFNRLQLKLQLFQRHPSPTCKDKQCNLLRLIIESPWSMTQDHLDFVHVGWGRGLRDRPVRCI